MENGKTYFQTNKQQNIYQQAPNYMISPTTILLVDAARTIINSDEHYNIETWSLNKELADFLHNLGNKVIVVTNADGQKLDKVKTILSDYSFDIFSLERNPNKTDPIYFQHLLDTYQISPEDCFYFDHKQENLDAAKQAGIK